MYGCDVGNDECYDIASTEQYSTDNTYAGLPKHKDNERNCQPAKRFNGSCIFPASLNVVHDIVEAAKTRDRATREDRHVLIRNDVNTCRIGSSGALSYGTQMKSHASFIQHDGANDCRRNGKINKKSMSEHHVAKIAKLTRKWEWRGNQLTSGIKVGTVYKGHNEVGCSAAENGNGKSRNILITAKRYGQKRIYAAECRRKHRRENKRNKPKGR